MLTVKDLMTVNPETVSASTPLRQAIDIMKRKGYRQLPVVQDEKLVGILTDRDIRLWVTSPLQSPEEFEQGAPVAAATVASCMTTDPMTVTPDTPAYKAAEMLSIYKFGAFPVVENNALVGIITVTDFLDYMAARS